MKLRVLQKNAGSIIFAMLLLVSVAPVWTVPYFLTGDGPCHLYNASILNKWVHGQGAYFKEFFFFNTALIPNWFSHGLLVLLMQMFSPISADKIVITACLVLFATGFRYFINSFSARQGYISFWVFPFLWQWAMLMGFYNYMFSVGAYFFIAGYWLRHPVNSWKQIILISTACILLFLTHLIGVFLTIGTLLVLSVPQALHIKVQIKDARKLTPLLVIAPSTLLVLKYVKGRTPAPELWKTPFDSLSYNLMHAFTIQNMTDREGGLALIIVLVFAALLLTALITARRNRPTENICQVSLLIFIGTTAAYFSGNGEMFGGSFILFRLESLVYLLGLVFIASVPLRLPRFVKPASVLVASAISILFIVNRMHSFTEASNVVSEFRTLGPLIPDKSVVLPLKYNDFPHDREGLPIATKVKYFAHAMELMELEKDVVFYENYEAATSYFPLRWQESKDPWEKLAVGKGFEHVPPEADLRTYNNTVVPINYVVVWGDKVPPSESTRSGVLSKTIDEDYDLIQTTPVYKIKLYALKSPKRST